MTTNQKFAIIGAGNGGKAMAAHLALMGFGVALYNRTLDHIAEIKARGGLDLQSPVGVPQGFAKLELTTSNIAEAIKDASVIMVVVPSVGHMNIARSIAPYVKSGQVVVLNPGRTFGALEFTKTLKEYGCKADITVAEAETLIYISRSEKPAEAMIARIKDEVPIAALPSSKTKIVLDKLKGAFPQFVDGISVLHTGLNNIGAVFHPALTLLNSGWIEATGGNYQFYTEGLTPSIAQVVRAIDSERVQVAASLGIKVRTALEWLKMSYNSTETDLLSAIHNQYGYNGIKAPPNLNHRYLFEDVPNGLVPIASVGLSHGVSAEGMISIIQLSSIVGNTNYWKEGRTAEKLGIANLNTQQLIEFVNRGTLPNSK